MAATSGNVKLTPAERRRALFGQQVQRRLGKGYGELKAREYSLADWWLSELRKLPPARRQVEADRFERLVSALNEGRVSDDSV